MSENIIRKDIIQLEFETNTKGLSKVNGEIGDIKRLLTGGIGEDAFQDLKNNSGSCVRPLQDVNKRGQEVKNTLNDIGKKASTAAFNGLKKVAGVSFKALTVGAGAVATAIGKIAYESVQAYGEYEQLKGGMLKIFDQADTKKIMKDAEKAYLDLGMSANQYLGKINDTGANFASTMGDQKGYETARTGMLAISNYASGTGKSIDLLSEKFTMITRASSSYQSIADQFSGILPATSKDFLAQAQAAGFLEKGYKKLTDVPIAEYQESVAKMLEKGVQSLGLAGNTAAEAEGTVTGSLGMMKAAWSNLLVSFGTGEGLDKNFDNFIEAAEAFGVQTIPIAEKALTGMGKVVEKIAPIIAEKLPTLADQLLPPLIKATIELGKGLIKAIPSILKTVGETVVDVLSEQFSAVGAIGDFIEKHGGALKKTTSVLVGLAGALMLFSKLKSVTSVFSGLFGKSNGGSGGGSENPAGGITNIFSGLAKAKPTTILKGMGNLAIILGGLTALTAGIMALAPHMAKLSDGKSLFEVITVMTVLGTLGAVMTHFAGLAGAIPVSTVALGLANMAIMIGGLTALSAAFMAVAPYVAKLYDGKSIKTVVTVMTALGGVGTVLTVFAGIAGIIPIPVVLAGLANIALVLGGLTALIAAYGALAQIKGFNEFMTKGGETLANLFNIVGKCVGSVVGGLAEGITNSLPKIGENLSAFAKSLKPVFTMFEGVDAGGIGSFFKALGSFMLQMGGNKIVEFFTGKTDFSGVVDGLKSLTDEGVKNFFAMVNTIPAEAFDKGKKFFTCLDGISALPNTGGIGQMFSGENDFSGVASGLKTLSGEGVKKFFTMVSGLEPTAFDNATAFFKALSGISKLPNSGGMAQWFSGENDFSGVAEGLKTLSSEGVQRFFTMVNGLNLENLNGLWKSLKDAGSITTKNLSIALDDGMKDLVDKISKLPKKMGDALKNNSKGLSDGFVEMWKAAVKASVAPVNKLLDGANHILKEFGSDKKVISWQPYAKGTGGHKGGNALVNDGRGAELVQMPNGHTFIPKGRNVFIPNAPKGMKVLSAEQTAMLMGRHSPTFRYANGTSMHERLPVKDIAKRKKSRSVLDKLSDALSIISLIPAVDTFSDFAAVFVDLARGDWKGAGLNALGIIPVWGEVADEINLARKGLATLQAASAVNNQISRYADGIGNIDIWDFYENATGLANKVAEGIGYKGMSGFPLMAGQNMVSTFTGAMGGWINKLFNEEGGKSLASYVASKGVGQWRSTVIRALKMEGQYSAANVARTLFQMQTESGGNPKAINLWDSNAKKGIPSKGLMQVIDPTFKAYARKGFNKNIYDPLSNILASVRYAVSRYGTLGRAFRGVGYGNGGIVTKPTFGVFGEEGAEANIPLDPSKRKQGIGLWAKAGEMLGMQYSPESDSGHFAATVTENNTYAPHFEINISGTSDDRAMARKVKRWVAEAWEDMLDKMESKNPQTQRI